MTNNLPDPTNASRATPTIPVSDAILHIGSSTFISASSLEVWEVLINTSTWPAWNSFIPKVTIRSQPDSMSNEPLSPIFQKGTTFTFHVSAEPTITFNIPLAVTEFTAPNPESASPGHIVWTVDYDAPGAPPPFLLVGERMHELKDVELMVDDRLLRGTEVRHWEAMMGWLAHAVQWIYGRKLQQGFDTWVSDLKTFMENVNDQT
ncbi:uncharacterized protein PGRI_084300 [Penicillium griseofulvum]|uniref:Polyketide cyclase/dehydrase n=1 Tax=Penicillium patulum TaxID=5078 RepID=A0A135LT92_PENPA|nr:uncharacterized protein PGRI_084300 [Penicillium griseofulvum]KXG52146.1 hypothetical protein PGRI_084300 [Penicillium griseofulvum]